MNICRCCLHKLNKSVEIKNEPRDLVPSVLESNMYADFESYDTFKSVICIGVAE